MVKITELRIGNLIYLFGDVVCLNSEQLIYLLSTQSTPEPITLNEDWLLKLGFRNHAEFPEHYRYGSRLIIKRQTGFYDYGSNTRLKHVHRLQNLYFELGYELTMA